jgi:hypothetical protein
MLAGPQLSRLELAPTWMRTPSADRRTEADAETDVGRYDAQQHPQQAGSLPCKGIDRWS